MSDDPLKTAQTFLYYSFGRAAEVAQLMEKELVTLVLIPAMLRKTPINSAELESLIAKLGKSTLGQLLTPRGACKIEPRRPIIYRRVVL